MADITTLKVPETNLVAPSSWGSRDSIKKMLEKIWKNYGSYLKTASENSKIPAAMLASFIAVESGGKVDAGPAGHVTQGLMQWNREYAKSQLETELEKGRMTAEEKSILAKYGIVFDTKGKTRVITNADQLKPELNILIGSILLGQLVDTDWGNDDGKIRLDRIIAVYNAGAYGTTGKLARGKTHASAAQLANAVNPTTRAYIQKIMGKDGALDIAVNELKLA